MALVDSSGNVIKSKREMGIKLPHESNREWPNLGFMSTFGLTVSEVTKNYQVYHPMVIQSALGALSIACQNHVVVQRPGSRDTHPISLNLLTIAESGARKTTIEDVMFSPVRDKEHELMERYREEKASYSNELSIWTSKYKVLNRMLAKQVEKGENTEDIENQIRAAQQTQPLEPMKPSFIFEDTSRSALFKSMKEGLPMGLLLSSEADHVLNGMAFQDNSAMNSLWSGSDVKINRSTAEDITLKNCRLTVALQIQPAAFDHFMRKRGAKAHGTGLLARFLTVRVPEHTVPRKFLHSSGSHRVRDFHEKVESLLNTGIEFLKSGRTDCEVLTFDDYARLAWKKLSEDIEYEQMPGRRLVNAKDFASKMMENISRIAALLHLCDRYDEKNNEINLETFQFAADLCLHYADTFKNEFVPKPESIEKAEKAYLKLCEIYGEYPEANGIRMFDTDLYKKGVIRKPGDKADIYELLIEWGAVSWSHVDQHYYFHPDCCRGDLIDAYRQIETKAWNKPYEVPGRPQRSLL